LPAKDETTVARVGEVGEYVRLGPKTVVEEAAEAAVALAAAAARAAAAAVKAAAATDVTFSVAAAGITTVAAKCLCFLCLFHSL
jgi:hypothetical protein